MTVSFHPVQAIEDDSQGQYHVDDTCYLCAETLGRRGVVAHDRGGENHSVVHTECILRWLREKTTCPVCRADVDTSSLPSQENRIVKILSPLLKTLALGVSLSSISGTVWSIISLSAQASNASMRAASSGYRLLGALEASIVGILTGGTLGFFKGISDMLNPQQFENSPCCIAILSAIQSALMESFGILSVDDLLGGELTATDILKMMSIAAFSGIITSEKIAKAITRRFA